MAVRQISLVVLLVASVGAPPAQQSGQDGTEFQVASADLYQSYPAVAASDSGAFVVVWEARHDFEIWQRRFDASGTPLDEAFVVGSSYGPYRPATPGVASDGPGGFVVVWSGTDGDYYGVRARRLDATGTPLGAEFQVNTATSYHQFYPAVAMSPLGDFVVVWQDAAQSFHDIRARRYDNAGDPHGGELQITPLSDDHRDADVAMDALGNFVAVWSSDDGDGYGIFGRIYDESGRQLGDPFRINEYTTGQQRVPAVAMDDSGDFVVVWQGGDEGWWLSARRFSADGAPLDATEFRVDPGGEFWHSRPDVATSESNGFVVVWEDFNGDGDKDGIFGRRYDSGGQSVGSVFQVNTHTAGAQVYPAVAMAPSGDFVVVWEGPEPEGSRDGVFGQRFCATPVASAPEPQAVCAGGVASFEVAADGRLPLAHQWRRDGGDLTDGGNLHGVTGPTLTIDPVGPFDGGDYDCVIVDGCPASQTIVSPAASLVVLTAPGPTSGLILAKEENGLALRLTWTDAAGAEDYVVREDTHPEGEFDSITGTAAGGAVGLLTSMPEGTRCFLVAGRNASCGEGPLR